MKPNTHLSQLALISASLAISTALPAQVRPERVMMKTPPLTEAVLRPAKTKPIAEVTADDPDDLVVIDTNGKQVTLGEMRAMKGKEKAEEPTPQFQKPRALDIAKPAAPKGKQVPLETPNSVAESNRATTINSILTHCDPKDAPKIGKVLGTITPGENVRISGRCFGDNAREVRLTGSNIPGIARLEISKWSSTLILGTIPAILGATPGESQIQVITQSNLGSVGHATQFQPAYGNVELFDGFTGCRSHKDYNNTIKCERNMIELESWEKTGVLERGENKVPAQKERREEWSISLNRNCSITYMGISGFSYNRPESSYSTGYNNPSAGVISFTLKAQAFTKEVVTGDTITYRVSASVKALANCPIGIDPFSK